MPALTRATIPPHRLAALNAGTEESRVLVEWLAMDHGELLRSVLRGQFQLPPSQSFLAELASLPVPKRMARIAEHLVQRNLPGLRESLELHPSDSVRIWAALMAGLEPDRSLEDRLGALRVLACDPHAGVREYAWMAFRPHLAEQLEKGLGLLLPLTRSTHPSLRRFVSEVSRPRGVWCAHLRALRADPAPARPLLDALRADPDRYVQTSVGNWLNDASKDHPEWVQALAADWAQASPGPATAWILRHGLRTLRKQPR
jgi:3-methyladenine DNA glycosylase AlkC